MRSPGNFTGHAPLPKRLTRQLWRIDHEQVRRMAMQPRQDDTTAERTPVEARQGVISGRVITVLMVSLLLAVVALFIGYWIVR
jgi:hypothetical protein